MHFKRRNQNGLFNRSLSARSNSRVLDCRRDGREFEPHQQNSPCCDPATAYYWVPGVKPGAGGGVVGVVNNYITGSYSTATVSITRLSLPLCHYGVGTDVASLKVKKVL